MPPNISSLRTTESRGGLPTPRPSLDKSQKILFATWGLAVGLALVQDVIQKKDWPCPGRYVKITALYLILGVLAEVNGPLAATLGVGYALVFFTRQAGREVQKSGTFFGIKVK